jgi:4-hydroxybenzoate polyprenyltransferase
VGWHIVAFTLNIGLCPLVGLGVNDVYDYETDRRNPRKLVDKFEGSVLDPVHQKDVLVAAYISTIILLSTSLATQSRDNIIATTLLVFILWQYSSPPLRIKEIPILDSLSNGCLLFLTWFFGFSLYGSSFSEVPLKAIMMSFCVVGGHALAAMADFEADAAAGLRTIATVVGKRPAAIFAALCL